MDLAAYALTLEQGSEDWLQFRVGKVSASRIADITAKLRNGASGASRAAYLGEIVCERLTGQPASNYTNAAMEWGTQHEPMARAAYQLDRLRSVKRVGCVLHPVIPDAIASPDGLIDDDGLCEIKCPAVTNNHIELLLGGPISDRYMQQMQWQLACTSRHWCDFISFDPRMPEPMQLWVKRIERDDLRLSILEQEVRAFLDEVEDRLARLVERYPSAEAAA